jgi:hypothetical protein
MDPIVLKQRSAVLLLDLLVHGWRNREKHCRHAALVSPAERYATRRPDSGYFGFRACSAKPSANFE